MDYHIAITLIVIGLTLVAFIREWASPDVLALSILCLVVALGLITPQEMTLVFRNEAPLTIAALFVIGGALERSGAVARIGTILQKNLKGGTRMSILAFSLVAAFFSAWMNNTAIVAVLLPVTLGFARSKEIPASRLLMPLSYASILGGCCTLIGTSTNLLVNGTLRDMGEKPMSMFELAPVGIPLAIAGIGYLVIFGPKLIPARPSISGSLEIDVRTTPLYHILISPKSALVGKRLADTPLADRESGLHIMEVRRGGTRVMLPLSRIIIEKNDRFLIAIHRRRGGGAKAAELLEQIGAELLSTVDGIVSELVVRDESSIVGKTLATSDFRQNYTCVVLAVHRSGINITSRIAELPIDAGDTLLVITALNNLRALAQTKDFVLTDTLEGEESEDGPGTKLNFKAILAWSTLAAVVLTATLTDMIHRMNPEFQPIPIHYAALVGALVLLWLRVLTPREAYASVDWQVLLMLYGLLGLGMAMQKTGTAEWLARGLVGIASSVVPEALLPIVLLWTVFILVLLLTEVLSNNATAVMMVPIVITLASELGVDSRPFIISVAIAASCAFALPMGYQTHMMIYGPGGYKFTDFQRVGIPLNLLCWVVACTLIPIIWPF